MVEDLKNYWQSNLKKNYMFLSAVMGDSLSSISIIIFSGMIGQFSRLEQTYY